MFHRSVDAIEIHRRDSGDITGNQIPIEEYQKKEEIAKNLRKQLSAILRPIFLVMKLTGQYFGTTAMFEENMQKTWCVSRLYSTFVALGQWLLFLIAVTSHCYLGFKEMNQFFFLLVSTVWFLQCASATTICLVAFPFAQSRKSKMSIFIASLVEAAPELNLDGIKAKTVKGLVLACSAATLNLVVIVMMSVYFGGTISVFSPWEKYTFLRWVELIFGTYCSFSWCFPVLIFCVTCMLLETMFTSLQNQVSDRFIHSLSITYLRKEHLKLCHTVQLANAIFSPLLFIIVTLDVPLICVNFHQLIKSSADTDRITIVGYFYWTFCISSFLIVVFLFGNRVNEKVNFYLSIRKKILEINK